MVGLGGLPIAHDDVEDFEGGPGTGGVQWIGRKGVRGWCIHLAFLPGAPFPWAHITCTTSWFPVAEQRQRQLLLLLLLLC